MELQYHDSDYFNERKDHEFLVESAMGDFKVAVLSFEKGNYWFTYTVGEYMADRRKLNSYCHWLNRVSYKASTLKCVSLTEKLK